MKSTCLKCGVVADLPDGHRLVVCSACGAVQDKVRAASGVTEQIAETPENQAQPSEKLSLPLIQVEMRVTEHLIECGKISYQIRNLTATAIGSRKVPIKVTEPIMKTPAPSAGIGTALLLGGLAGSFWWALMPAHHFLGFALGFVIFVAISVTLSRKFRAEIEPWKRTAEQVKMQHIRWKALANSPITLFSLVLETNAGSNPIFHSTEQLEIVRANEAIKDAMSKNVAEGKSLSITVLDVPFKDESESFDVAIERLAAAVGRQYVYGDS